MQRHDDTNPPRRALSSLLTYIDHELPAHATKRAHSPASASTCIICVGSPWIPAPSSLPLAPSTAPPPSRHALLPLSHCSHPVHTHCLIQQATCTWSPYRDACRACGTRPFVWDGISALTLSARSGTPMGDDASGGERARYEAQCGAIWGVIRARFYAQLGVPSGFADGSPDLVAC